MALTSFSGAGCSWDSSWDSWSSLNFPPLLHIRGRKVPHDCCEHVSKVRIHEFHYVKGQYSEYHCARLIKGSGPFLKHTKLELVHPNFLQIPRSCAYLTQRRCHLLNEVQHFLPKPHNPSILWSQVLVKVWNVVTSALSTLITLPLIKNLNVNLFICLLAETFLFKLSFGLAKVSPHCEWEMAKALPWLYFKPVCSASVLKSWKSPFLAIPGVRALSCRPQQPVRMTPITKLRSINYSMKNANRTFEYDYLICVFGNLLFYQNQRFLFVPLRI